MMENYAGNIMRNDCVAIPDMRDGSGCATVKEVTENTYAILNEIGNVVRMIRDALIGQEPMKNQEINEPRPDKSMVDTMVEQRDLAERILKDIVRVRDALW